MTPKTTNMDHSHHNMDHSQHRLMDHASMDHGSMGHGGMDHGGMDHGGMDHGNTGNQCNMHMTFTWDTSNLCIVFQRWRVTSTFSLLVSLLAIVALVAGYEALREGIRRYEVVMSKRLLTAPRQNRAVVTRRAHLIKSALYGIQNFYAFMIMLIFMTYNGWVMVAVSVGAAVGYSIFGAQTTATKDTACH